MSDTATHSRGGDFATSRRGIDADELVFIAEQAGKGRTPQQVARMIGRAFADVLDAWPSAAEPVKRKEPRRMVLSLWKGLIEAKPERVTLESLKWEVAREYGVTVEELEGQGRTRSITVPRQDLMWRMVQAKRWSLPQIGRCLGGRDHTTVMHGVKAHQARLDAAQDQAEAA